MQEVDGADKGGSCKENTGNDFIGNVAHFERIAEDRISKVMMDFYMK